MSRLLPLNSYTLFTQMGLSTLLGLSMSCTYANTSAYSDADFAAHAVKTPTVVHEYDVGYDRYNYRSRYSESNEKEERLQKIEEEQKSYDAQISSIPRSNESDAAYQARMVKEQNPVWLKQQAQAKLQAQIIDHQEEKRNQKPVIGAAINLPPSNINNNSSNNLGTTELAHSGAANYSLGTPSMNALNVNPTNLPEPSYDNAPMNSSAGTHFGPSLFYWLLIVSALIFIIRLIRR